MITSRYGEPPHDGPPTRILGHLHEDDERQTAPRCSHCHGAGCDRCQHTGYAGGREP